MSLPVSGTRTIAASAALASHFGAEASEASWQILPSPERTESSAFVAVRSGEAEKRVMSDWQANVYRQASRSTGELRSGGSASRESQVIENAADDVCILAQGDARAAGRVVS